MNLQEIRRNPWPYAIVAYFAVFISAMVCWAVFAIGQRQDLVRTDYYEEELRHQSQMDRVSRSASMPARIGLSDATGGRSLVIALPSAHAGRGATGSIELYRPSDSRLDQRMPLTAGVDGVQRVDAAGLRDGLWKVRVRWTVGADEFYTDRDVVVGAPQS